MRRSSFPVERLLMDVAFTLFALFAGLLAISLAVLRLPAPQAEATPSMTMGDIMVEARWPDGVDADVDLWVRAPEDQQAVGYSRRADRQTGYVRDDVGNGPGDPGDLNYENAMVRGLLPGRYVVDVHLYASRGHAPVTVQVAAVLVPAPGRVGRVLARREVVLREDGQEETAFSFVVDDKKQVGPPDTSAYIPLRDPAVQR